MDPTNGSPLQNQEIDMVLLQQQFYEMKTRIERLEEENTSLQNERTILQQRITEQRRSPPQPPSLAIPTPIEMPTPSSQLSYVNQKPKLPTPEAFNNERLDYPIWKRKVRNKLREDGPIIGLTPSSQTSYILALLSEEAARYCEPFVRRTEHLSPEALFNHLDNRYEDPMARARALEKLRRIRQGARTFIEFLAEYESLASEAGTDDWNKESRKDHLLARISYELQQFAVTVLSIQKLDLYKDLIKLLHSLDTRFRAAKQDRAFRFQLGYQKP